MHWIVFVPNDGEVDTGVPRGPDEELFGKIH
jgi:hypothetical protein